MFALFSTKTKGDCAEEIAKNYLEKQGLSFVSNQFRSRFGEIDLVFKDKGCLVFVEVRYRKNTNFGNSIETVNYHKQQKIIKTAQYYLQKHQLTESVNCRFDIIGIDTNNIMTPNTLDTNSIQWIPNAFSYLY